MDALHFGPEVPTRRDIIRSPSDLVDQALEPLFRPRLDPVPLTDPEPGANTPSPLVGQNSHIPKMIFIFCSKIGTSVFGMKYKDGVILAADTLGSYGSLARYPDLERVIRVNDTTVVACSGDYADFQFLREVIEQKQVKNILSSFISRGE